MAGKRSFNQKQTTTIVIVLTLISIFIGTAVALGHGGKHPDQFTHLQALQKAVKLLDQLVAKGKLDSRWETDLQNIAISKRKKKGKEEVMVSFQRRAGEPKAVYIFFNSKGKYAGSNFTGE